VSLYVDLSPQSRHNNAWEIDLKTHVRDALAAIEDRASRETVREVIEGMRRRLRDGISSLGRGAAFFSCPRRDVTWQVSLPLGLPTRLRVGRRPYLRPLARVWDEHDRFGVVLLDKQRARLFVSQLGFTEEVADIFEDVPGHHKQGGWSQMRFQRQHDARVMWHAGAVAHATELLMEQLEARHLLVSGPPEVLGEYRSHLSSAVAGLWAGEFGIPTEAPVDEVASAILPHQRRVEAEEEMQTIERLNDSISARRGVWGLAETLRAVLERRVRTLVVHDRYRAPGAECLRCRMLTANGSGSCPSCGNALEPIEDVVDALLENAVTQEAELELVRSDAARMKLPVGEPIGAILRF